MNEEVTIQCDASEKGLGGTLLQNGQPVSFASKALTKTEQHYAQIEKECLAIVFACEKFDQFLYGREKVTVHTDHKPLIPIFQKPIHSAPKRLQRMLLRLQKYELEIVHIPGKDMLIADWLSRAYLKGRRHQGQIFDELEHINQMEYVNVSESTQHQFQNATKADASLMELMLMVQHGWPEHRADVPVSIRQYFNYKDDITVQNGILFKGQRIIVPQSMQALMLRKTHSSHQGAEACIRRARDSLFWPGMGAQIQEMVSRCDTCNSLQPKQQKEKMMSWEIPTRPWQIVAQDLFVHNHTDYLITVDFYSDYWEVDRMEDTTSQTVINYTKKQFARHGIPQRIVTDNGPQFVSAEYRKFTRDWDIDHVTSSPRHSQSNGKAESAVKIVKSLIQKAHMDKRDVHLTILDWRNTPNADGKSPVQMLMSRRTRTLLPITEILLRPQVVEGVSDDIKARKQKAKFHYDKTARDLPELIIGEPVRLQPDLPKQPWRKATCLGQIGPRSYLVQTEEGQKYRRNRKFLRTTSEAVSAPLPTSAAPVAQHRRDSTPGNEQSRRELAEEPQDTTRTDSQHDESNNTTSVDDKAVRSTRTRRNIQKPAKYKDFVMN